MAKRGRPKGSKNNTIKQTDKEINQGLKHNNDLSHKLLEETKIIPVSQERKDRLNAVLREINKVIPNSIKYANAIEERKRVSFGHKCLDNLTNGGVPEGTYTTIWGSKGCGKTTIVLDLIAQAQKVGKQCIYINGERSYDPVWAKKRGVDVDNLVIVEVETIEQGLDTVIKLCRERVADLIVLDSLHGLAPKGELYEGKAEKEKSVEQDTMALRARKLTQFFEMATSYVADSKCAVILIGQSRMNLGGYIKIETLTGGHALLHNSRLILRLRRGQKVDSPKEKRPTGKLTAKGKQEMEAVQIGFDLVVHVEKSQIQGCTELSEIHVPFLYTEGIKE